jgi:hypothetical protein
MADRLAHFRPLAERIHAICLRVIRVSMAVGGLFALLGLLTHLLVGPRAGRWTSLPGFWAISAILAAAGPGSYAQAVLQMTEDGAMPRRVAAAALHVILGTFYFAAGCGGFWAFTVLVIRGRG